MTTYAEVTLEWAIKNEQELAAEIVELKQQRDDLLAALEALIKYHYHNVMGTNKEYDAAIKAIAKSKPKQAATPGAC